MRDAPHARRRGRDSRHRDESGLTLIEVLIAGFVLTVAVLALASVASASLVSIRDSGERDRGTATASSAIEAIRALEYDEIAMVTGDDWIDDPRVTFDGGEYLLDHDGDGAATETIWARAGGAIEPYLCTSDAPDACWFEIPTESRVTVRTFVTWYPSAVERSAKRITVLATWDDPSFSAPRTVRMSTVVAEVQRGLPAPAFEVLPGQGSVRLDDGKVGRLVDDGEEECLEHTVTNFGASDSYALAFDDGFAALSPMSQGTWQDDHWIVRAYFVPVDSDLERGDAGTLMTADEATGDALAPEDLDTGESARLHVCYAPRESDGTPLVASPYEEISTHTVRSQFDENVIQTVDHTIAVSSETFILYLQDPRLVEAAQDEDLEAQTSYLRPTKSGGAGGYHFDQFPMTTWVPAFSGMRDYDTGIEPQPNNEIDFHDAGDVSPFTRLHNRRGLWLPGVPVTFDGNAFDHEDFAAVFDWQFPGDSTGMTFGGDITVHVWVTRWPPDDASEGEICPGAEVQRLRPNGNLDAVVGADVEVVDTGGGWTQVQFTFPWEPGGPGTGAGEVTYDREEYVRLRIWNDATATNTANDERSCMDRFHLGYGASNFAARLVAEPTG